MAYRKKMSTKTRRTKRTVTKAVQRVLKKHVEVKRFIPAAFNRSSFSALKHLVVYDTAPLQILNAGSGEGQRISTAINVKDLYLTINWQSIASTAPFTKIRVMVFWSDNEYAAPPTNLHANFVASDLLLSNTYQTESIYGKPDLKTGVIDRLMYDKTFTNECNFSGAFAKSVVKNIRVPINQKVDYRNDGYLRQNQLYAVIIPYIGGGSAGSTDLPFFGMSSMITYTDL